MVWAACPPLLAGANVTDALVEAGCVVRRQRMYHEMLSVQSNRLTSLWLGALIDWRPRYQQRRYLAYLRLLEVIGEMECTALFINCFPEGVDLEAAAYCKIFRQLLNDVIDLDQKTGSVDAYLELGIPSVTHVKQLEDKHACWITDKGKMMAVVGEFLDMHDIILSQPLGLVYRLPGWRHNMSGGHYRDPAWRLSPVFNPGCGHVDLPLPGDSPDLLSMLDILDHGKVSQQEKGWVINVGAGNGECSYGPVGLHQLAEDPANCLLFQGHGGILYEGDDETAAALKARPWSRSDDVHLVLGMTDPAHVTKTIAQLAPHFGGRQLDLLKVDVDNCDCCFVEAILKSLQTMPRFVHVEVNPFVPPPIVFRPKEFDARLSQKSFTRSPGEWDQMIHCSLSAFEEALRPLGFELIHMAWQDAVFAEADVAKVLRKGQRSHSPDVPEQHRHRYKGLSQSEKLWLGGYYCHPLRLAREIEVAYKQAFLYDYRRWNDPEKPAEERLALIQDYLDAWKIPRRYELHIDSYSQL